MFYIPVSILHIKIKIHVRINYSVQRDLKGLDAMDFTAALQPSSVPDTCKQFLEDLEKWSCHADVIIYYFFMLGEKY